MEAKKKTFTYFFTKVDKRYRNGKRFRRSTKDNKGYWKITSKINEIREGKAQTLIGRKNALVYMYGDVKTDWIMHEYILDHNYANKKKVRYPLLYFSV